MRLSCPHCQTEYDVPDAALADRARLLRCSACRHEWRCQAMAGAAAVEIPAVPETEIPEPPALALPEDTRIVKPAPPSEKNRKAWLFSILVVLVAVAYVLLGRQQIMKIWPPSTRFYQAIGLD